MIRRAWRAQFARLGVVCVVCVLGVLTTGLPVAAQARRVVVISDLHLGLGRTASGDWDASEDFRWGEEFEQFLLALRGEHSGATDLVLNGDTFELLQAGDGRCRYADPVLGCTESDALARLTAVLDAHPREIQALGSFVRDGDNRLVLVPGDHDAALLFPRVGRRAVAAFGAADGRAMLATEGFWRSADGLIHAEHGHQIDRRGDWFANWPVPFTDVAGVTHLSRPWGHRVVQGLYDDHEARFPVVDNLADDSAGVRLLAAVGDVDIESERPGLLEYLLFRMSWQQFRMDLDRGDVQPPVWNLDDVRAEGARFLVESLLEDDPFMPLAEDALREGQLDELMERLRDDDLRAVCDYRAALRRARRRFERILTQLDPTGPPPEECPRMSDTAGPMFEYFWQSRDRLFGQYLEQRSTPDLPVAVFVHGHTHLPDYRQGNFTRVEAGRAYVVDGFSPVRNAVAPVVINGGAWQRTVTPVQLDRFVRERGQLDEETLGSLRLEQLPPCYSFVQIDPYVDEPEPPSLRYWRQDRDGRWGMARGCGRGLTEVSPP
jgi:UDP-2,3-diacylglucosamine pyrophosphatase LpxH